MSTEPSLSVVVATHNRSALLREAVQSILEQTFRDVEVLIVDDASTDDTPSVLEALQALDPRIHSIRLTSNGGPGEARNRGIAAARADFIAILDDDDIALPRRLEIQRDILLSSPHLGLVFSTVNWIDDAGQVFATFPDLVHEGRFPDTSEDIFRLLYLERNYIQNTTLMLRRSKLHNLRYATFTRIGEDRMLFLQLAALNVPIRAISEPLVLMRRGARHVGLMDDHVAVLAARRRVLRAIRLWLKEQEIHRFDDLHRRAMANQLAREARYRGGLYGLSLCLQAVCLDPRNPLVITALNDFRRRAKSKWLPAWNS